MSMFDAKTRASRHPPPLPDPHGVEYPRAASWASGSCAAVLKDDKGCQLFRCFLFESLAEENLSFLEAVDKLKKMKNSNEKKDYAKEIVQLYSPSINLSSVAMKKIKDAVESENVDPEEFAPAVKEVKRLLENDQFPRFRRSEIYLNFLEKLLPRAYAERWMTSFEALLGNHVGRHHFRLFLREIHAEENLRFWEAVVEFRGMKNKSTAQLNAGKSCLNTFLAEGANNEVFLPFGVRQVIEKKIQEKDVDISLFDEAIKHVEQVHSFGNVYKKEVVSCIRN
uniref:RGS domain-containing protein n=1 Tax=Angiostrongylus cantonensis TaxID=6313 RepID=A0A0K0DR20_ANGCA